MIVAKTQTGIEKDQVVFKLNQKRLYVDKQRSGSVFKMMYGGIERHKFLCCINRIGAFVKGVDLQNVNLYVFTKVTI